MRENIYGPENRVVSAKFGRNVIFSGSGLYRDKHNASFTAGASANWYEQVPRVRSTDDEALLSLRLATTPAVGTAAGTVFDKAVGSCVFPTVKEWTEKGTIAKIPNDVYRCFCTYFFPKLGRLGQVREDGRIFVQRVAEVSGVGGLIRYGVYPQYCMPSFYPSTISVNRFVDGSTLVYGEAYGYTGGTGFTYGIVDTRNMVSYMMDCAPCSFYYDKAKKAFFVEGSTLATEIVSHEDVTLVDDYQGNAGASTVRTYRFPAPHVRTSFNVYRKEVVEGTMTGGLVTQVQMAAVPVSSFLSGTADVPCTCTVRAFGETIEFPATLEYRDGTARLRIPLFSRLTEVETIAIEESASSPNLYGFMYTAYLLWWSAHFNKYGTTPLGIVYIPDGYIEDVHTRMRPLTRASATEEVAGVSRTVSVCTSFEVDLSTLVSDKPAARTLLCAATADTAAWAGKYTLWATAPNPPASMLIMMVQYLIPSFTVPSSSATGDTSLVRAGDAYESYVDFSDAELVLSEDSFSIRPSPQMTMTGIDSYAPYIYVTRQLPGCAWTYAVSTEPAKTTQGVSIFSYPAEFTSLCIGSGSAITSTSFSDGAGQYSHAIGSVQYLMKGVVDDCAVSSMVGAYYFSYRSQPEDTMYNYYHLQSHALYYSAPSILHAAKETLDIRRNSESSWWYHGANYEDVQHTRSDTGAATYARVVFAPFNAPLSLLSGEVAETSSTYPLTTSISLPAVGEYDGHNSYRYFHGTTCTIDYVESGYGYEERIGSYSYAAGTYAVAETTFYIVLNDHYARQPREAIHDEETPVAVPSSIIGRGLPMYFTGSLRVADRGRCAVLPQGGVVVGGDTVLSYLMPEIPDTPYDPQYPVDPAVNIESIWCQESNECSMMCVIRVTAPSSYSMSIHNYATEILTPFGAQYRVATEVVGTLGVWVEGNTTGYSVLVRITIPSLLSLQPIPAKVSVRFIRENVYRNATTRVDYTLRFSPTMGGAALHRLNASSSFVKNGTYGTGPFSMTYSEEWTRTSYYNKKQRILPSIGMMNPALEECYEELGEAKYSVVQGYSAVPNGEGYAVFATPVLATKALFSQKALIGSTGYSATISALASAVSSAETSEAATALQAVRTRLEATATEAEKEGAAMAPTRVYEAFLYAFNETLEVLRNDFASVELMFLMSENRQSFALLPISAKLPSTDSLVKILS